MHYADVYTCLHLSYKIDKLHISPLHQELLKRNIDFKLDYFTRILLEKDIYIITS